MEFLLQSNNLLSYLNTSLKNIFHSIENIITEKNVDSINCNENILQHPVIHLPKPDISYVITHAQLSPKILEERISKFYSQKVPLMISTNIIENGLDLPHVNTIIVYRSNMFSLASLYQLKGRVGTSSKRAVMIRPLNQNIMLEINM